MAGHEVLVFTGSQQMLRRSPGSMRWTEHCSIPVPNIYKCKSGAWLNAIPSKGLGLHFQTSRNPCCIRVHLFRLPAFDSVLSMRIVAILSDQSPKHPQCSRKRSVRDASSFLVLSAPTSGPILHLVFSAAATLSSKQVPQRRSAQHSYVTSPR